MPVSEYGHDRQGWDARGPEGGGFGPGAPVRSGQPLSAVAIASERGVVGRPARRDRSPVDTTSSPFSMDASTSARTAARGSGSPGLVMILVSASTETGL